MKKIKLRMIIMSTIIMSTILFSYSVSAAATLTFSKFSNTPRNVLYTASSFFCRYYGCLM